MLNPVRQGQNRKSSHHRLGLFALVALTTGVGVVFAQPTQPVDTAKAAKVAPETATPAPAVLATPTGPAATSVPSPTPETLDTTAAAQTGAAMSQAADRATDSLAAHAAKDDSVKSALAALKEPTSVENAKLAKLKFGGVARTSAYARDISAESDAAKTLSMGVDLIRLGMQGEFGNGFGFNAELDYAKAAGGVSAAAVYVQWQKGAFDKVKAGRIKRAFSREAILSDALLPFNFRGALYQDFLRKANGYTGYDVGISFASGFEDAGIPVRYELGVYNGRKNDSVAGHYDVDAWKDSDLKAKDVAFRIEAEPMKGLLLEGALTTKTAEDRSDADNFDIKVNTAYQVGAFYTCKGLRVNGEFAYGDNHQGRDALIVKGSSDFLAFYIEAMLRSDYGNTGRWSETLLKFEGLDPDMGFGSDDGKPNDGKFRYTLGATYGFTRDVSVTLAWGFLQPISESQVSSDTRLRHDLDLFWKLVF
jgi:Phosphate-selective porin O and P